MIAIKNIFKLFGVKFKHDYTPPPMIKIHGNSKYGLRAYLDLDI